MVRFWRARGVDGFRLDAIERLMKDRELRDDPPATGPPALPVPAELARLDPARSRNDPEIGVALAALREAAGDALLVGEVYLPTAGLRPYLEHLDLAFAFELLHAPWEAERLRSVIAAAAELEGIAWVLSNHDFPRLATRLGADAVRAAAVLLLTLPGTVFVYQGDELGMADGAGGEPADRSLRPRPPSPPDAVGREPARRLQRARRPGWRRPTRECATSPTSAATHDSVLHLYRRLIALRRELRGELALVEAGPEVIAFARGEHLVAVNLGARPAPLPGEGEVVLASAELGPGRTIPPNGGSCGASRFEPVVTWATGELAKRPPGGRAARRRGDSWPQAALGPHCWRSWSARWQSLFSACGDDDDESGAGQTLTWFIFNEPSRLPADGGREVLEGVRGRL